MNEINNEKAEELAEWLHSKSCHYNHTDQCAWFYNKNWGSETNRIHYKDVAKNMLKLTNEIGLIKDIANMYELFGEECLNKIVLLYKSTKH